MADVIIKNVPDDVLTAIDARALRLRLSRNQYLQRWIARAATRSASTVTAAKLCSFVANFTDLADDVVMPAAWR